MTTPRHEYKVGRPPLSDGPTENCTFRLAITEHSNLKAHAKAQGVKKAVLIRDALEAKGLLEPPPPPKKRG